MGSLAGRVAIVTGGARAVFDRAFVRGGSLRQQVDDILRQAAGG